MNDYQINHWKLASASLRKRYPKDYEIIDWEQQENDTYVFNNLFGFGGELREDQIPF